MPFRDLREFLNKLEKEGQLVRLTRELESGYEVSALAWELQERWGPAVMFNLKGYDTPMVIQVHGTLQRNAMALGLEPRPTFKETFIQVRNHVAQKLENKSEWLKPKLVRDAPCQEVVLTGRDVNLYKLPIVKWSPLDGGPYVTFTNVITRDPGEPSHGLNTGTYRVMLHDERTTGIMCCATQDIGIHIGRARQRGLNKIPVAVVVGVEPVVNIVSTTKMGSFMEDEFEFAGALRGEPVELVPCKTVDLVVPATAELVLEGELDIDPEHARWEGPYGEFMGYYEAPMREPVFHVTAITHRREYIYQNIVLGHPNNESEIIRMPVIQANNYNYLRLTVNGFRDTYAPHRSRGYLHVVQIKKRFPGWGKQAVLATLGAGQVMAAANWVVVVDEDIDIYDMEQVAFAISTRMDPSRDIVLIPQVGVYPLNPAASDRKESPETGYTEFSFIGKMGIDATLKTALEVQRQPAIPVTPDPEAHKKILGLWAELGLPA